MDHSKVEVMGGSVMTSAGQDAATYQHCTFIIKKDNWKARPAFILALFACLLALASFSVTLQTHFNAFVHPKTEIRIPMDMSEEVSPISDTQTLQTITLQTKEDDV